MSDTLFDAAEVSELDAAAETDRAKLQADEITWRRRSERRMATITGPLFGPDQEEMF